MEKIKVSVIIPVYNMEQYLEQCLTSILAQTLKEIEVICINDGSTDNSLNILNKYKEKNLNIKVISQKNQGSGLARNLGINIANGEFVAFVDADDYYAENDVLEYLYKCAKREKVSICGGGLVHEQEGQVFINKEESESFIKNGIIKYKDFQHICGYTGFIFSKVLLKENLIYFPNYRRFQDIPFVVKAMIYADIFYVVSKTVYVYRSVDKLISYKNEDIVNGIAKGIDDVLVMSKKAGYEILHTDIVQKMLETYIEWFYRSIYNGNKLMIDLIQKIWDDIDEELLVKDGRMTSKPEFKNEQEIDNYFEDIKYKKENFWKKIECFKHIIIYGAGMMGRRLFEYLIENNYKGIVDFAVSIPNPSGFACGKSIHSITTFLPNKDNVLVLIAVKGNDCYTMLNKAQKLGYRNVEIIFYKDIMLF